MVWETWSAAEQINLDIINDKAALSIGYMPGDGADRVTGSLTLPKAGENGTTISWSVSSGDEGLINTDTGEVTRPIGEDKIVVLTATVSKDGGVSSTKEFILKVLRGSIFDYDLSLDVQTGEQSVTVTASVERLNSAAQDGVLILALYHKSKLLDIIIDGGLTGNIYETTVDLSFPGYDMSDDIHLTGVVWDCVKNMKPIGPYKNWRFGG